MHNILHVPGWIWDAFGVVWGDILGSQTDLVGNMFEGTRKTCGFRKNSTACRREARFGGSRGHTWSFGGPKNDVKWGQNSDGISGPKLGGYFGPTEGAGADPS